MTGIFIVLEGIDGSGKTTQVQLLAERLRSVGRRVVTTRQPSDGPLGKQIRGVLTGEALPLDDRTMGLLFAADRSEHLARVVRPALADGAVVVCDRYDLSNLAYQGARAALLQGPEAGVATEAWLSAVGQHAQRPDLTVVLDVPLERAAARRRARAEQAELYEEDRLLALVAGRYARATSLLPRDRVVHVDASGGPEGAAEAVYEAVRPMLGAAP